MRFALLAVACLQLCAWAQEDTMRIGVLDWVSNEASNELWDGDITLRLIGRPSLPFGPARR